MAGEVKKTIDELGHAFEEYKKANDQHLEEIEQRLNEIKEQGTADAVLKDKVEKISTFDYEMCGRLDRTEEKLKRLREAVHHVIVILREKGGQQEPLEKRVDEALRRLAVEYGRTG